MPVVVLYDPLSCAVPNIYPIVEGLIGSVIVKLVALLVPEIDTLINTFLPSIWYAFFATVGDPEKPTTTGAQSRNLVAYTGFCIRLTAVNVGTVHVYPAPA